MPAATTFWKERLHVPAYRLTDAARYAGTSTQTVGNWHKLTDAGHSALTQREPGDLLTYLQLIEVGVVAAMRKAGVPLKSIQRARDYLASKFDAKHPFAEFRFKTDGKDLLVESGELNPDERDRLVAVSENGQYVWREIIQQLLREFEYPADDDGPAVRWRVAGQDKPIIIDPRVSYGSPQVSGIATWVLRDRWDSGESVQDIAGDFDVAESAIMAALHFEGRTIDLDRPNQWTH